MRVAWVVVGVALAVAGCTSGELDLTGRQCPCVAGWRCEPLDNICVPDGPPDGAPRDGADPGDGSSGGDGGTHDGGRDDGGAPLDDGGLLDAPVIQSDSGPTVEPPWWDTDWAARQELRIENVAGTVLPTGLQVGFAVDLAGLLGTASIESLRVVRWDATGRTWSEVDRHVDEATGVADDWVWVEVVDDIPAGTIDDAYWLYWDNPSPPAASAPSEVFDLYDGFGGSALASHWEGQGSYVLAGGELLLSRGGTIRTHSMRLGPGFAVDFAMRVTSLSDYYYWGGFQRETDFIDSEPWIIWINRGSDVGRIWSEVKANEVGIDSALSGPHIDQDTEWHIYGVDRLEGEVVFRYDNQVSNTTALGASYTRALQLRLRSAGTTGPELRFDWLRVRKTIHPYPTVERGPREMRP